ncbi:hypothetical protein [Paenibacillus rigui]|uniref:Uncharacterized protein n=1 Tax=Paenibacillus rigui TaxID=554312 RepID=A0A229UKP8_9BACL|nr:hypothetical protein [Paenibacillus rigui]OXM83963.1 hypothetical protein CF651_22890 [Paenibacillus rigui]
MAYWKEIRGILPPQTIRQFKGVYNSEDSGFSTPEGFAQDIRNISSQSYPALSLKPGHSLLGSNLGGRVTGLLKWQETELHAIANGVWSKWTGIAWSSVATGLSTSADCSFANFKGNLSAINLIMANGVDAPRRYDGTTVQVLAGAPTTGNFVEQHDNRLYMATGNTISYSALSKADDWSTPKDAGQIVLETNNGQSIIGLRGGNQHLTVFKKSSIHELFGTGPNNYRLIEVANDIGAFSNKAIINAAGVLYFISNRIYQYNGGSRPDFEFSKPVQNYISGINPNATDKCVAGTNGRNVYFGIPYGTATECNLILEYDTQQGAWYVWDNIPVTQFIKQGYSAWFSGDTNGNVFMMGTGSTDNGTATHWAWISPPYGAETLARRTNWYNMYLIVDLPPGSSLNVSLNRSANDDTQWYLVKSITPQNGIQNARIIIPLATVALSNFVRVKLDGFGPFKLYEFNRQMREMPIK